MVYYFFFSLTFCSRLWLTSSEDGLLLLLYNDVSRELPVDSEQQHRSQSSEDVGETSGRRNSRLWLLGPNGNYLNFSANRESLKQYISFLFTFQALWVLLDKHHSPPHSEEEKLINYEDFLQVASLGGPKCKYVFSDKLHCITEIVCVCNHYMHKCVCSNKFNIKGKPGKVK